jgi:hypothetical protein
MHGQVHWWPTHDSMENGKYTLFAQKKSAYYAIVTVNNFENERILTKIY